VNTTTSKNCTANNYQTLSETQKRLASAVHADILSHVGIIEQSMLLPGGAEWIYRITNNIAVTTPE
jgi:hypothetical protein